MFTMMKSIKLTGRLRAIAGYIRDGASVADIGTDHGLLPVYLAQTGLARYIIASDISADSLESARISAAKYGVSDMIVFINAPGLDCISAANETGAAMVDTIVIAGMGGETIAGILNESSRTIKPGIRLILQPQSKTDTLCRFLYNNGYVIGSTKIALDKGRRYTVILCEDSNNA